MPRLACENFRDRHAFVLGLASALSPTHTVHSNRESGLGRPDVSILPRVPGGPAAILEFKRVDAESDAEAALEAALPQIAERRTAVAAAERLVTAEKVAVVFTTPASVGKAQSSSSMWIPSRPPMAGGISMRCRITGWFLPNASPAAMRKIRL